MGIGISAARANQLSPTAKSRTIDEAGRTKRLWVKRPRSASMSENSSGLLATQVGLASTARAKAMASGMAVTGCHESA